MTAPNQLTATTTADVPATLRPPIVVTPAKQHTARRIAVSKAGANRRDK